MRSSEDIRKIILHRLEHLYEGRLYKTASEEFRKGYEEALVDILLIFDESSLRVFRQM